MVQWFDSPDNVQPPAQEIAPVTSDDSQCVPLVAGNEGTVDTSTDDEPENRDGKGGPTSSHTKESRAVSISSEAHMDVTSEDENSMGPQNSLGKKRPRRGSSDGGSSEKSSRKSSGEESSPGGKTRKGAGQQNSPVVSRNPLGSRLRRSTRAKKAPAATLDATRTMSARPPRKKRKYTSAPTVDDAADADDESDEVKPRIWTLRNPLEGTVSSMPEDMANEVIDLTDSDGEEDVKRWLKVTPRDDAHIVSRHTFKFFDVIGKEREFTFNFTVSILFSTVVFEI